MVVAQHPSRRLLLITPFFPPNVGGVETRLNDLVKTLSSLGHTVDVITYQPLTTPVKGAVYERKKNLSIIRIPWPGKDWFHKLLKWPALEVLYIVPGLLLISFFYMIRHHRNVDTIHTPGLNSALIGNFLHFVFRTPWVMSTHTIYEMKPQSRMARITRFFLSSADHLIALSEPSRQELIGIRLPSERISVELTWIDQARFRPLHKQDCRRKLGIAEDVFMVLFVGRLIEEKGVKVLIECARRLPDVSFTIVGIGPMECLVTDAARKLGNISFRGYIPQETLPFYYNAAHLFVLPSLYREGLGRVVVESLACGLPVLLSDRAAIGPLVEKAAFLTPPDPDAMAPLISRLSRESAALEMKRQNTRGLAEKLFASKNVNGLLRAYRWVS